MKPNDFTFNTTIKFIQKMSKISVNSSSFYLTNSVYLTLKDNT